MTAPTRDTDDLKRQLRDKESDVKAHERRFEAAATVHRKELAAALAEGNDAHALAHDLRGSLEVRNNDQRRVDG